MSHHVAPYLKRYKTRVFLESCWPRLKGNDVQSLEERSILYSCIYQTYGERVLHNKDIVQMLQKFVPVMDSDELKLDSKFHFDLNEIDFVQEGGFGCVVFLKNKRMVVKLEFLVGSINTRNKQECMLNRHIGNSYMQFPFKNPFALATYEVYVVNSKDVATALIISLQKLNACEPLRRKLLDFGDKEMNYIQVITSQRASEKNLNDWIPPMDTKWWFHLAFQLLYATTCNYFLLDVIHRDLKPNNIVVDKTNNAPVHLHVRVVDKSNSTPEHLHVKEKSFYYQYEWRFCIIDFGISISNLYTVEALYDMKPPTEEKEEPLTEEEKASLIEKKNALHKILYPMLMNRGTYAYLFPATFVYRKVEDGKLTNHLINGYEEEMKSVANDVWSIGILLFDMAFQKWANQNASHLAQVIKGRTVNKSVMFHMGERLTRANFGDVAVGAMTVFLNILQLQKVLKNDFRTQLGTRIKDSILDIYSDDTFMNNLMENGHYWRSIESEKREDENFFVAVVKQLNKNDLRMVNLIRKCLHWDYKEREKIITKKTLSQMGSIQKFIQ